MDRGDTLRGNLVGLSKKLDKVLIRRKTEERVHGKVVGTVVIKSDLFLKALQREKGVKRIKAFLVLPVAALEFAIMPGCVRTNELMPDSQVGSSFLKKGLDVPFTVGKRFVNSKPLSVWTHFTWMPLWAYHFTSRFRKSAEE